jgi:hypothetical protein
MSTIDFSVSCKVCHKEVDSFSQNIRFILVPDEAVQEQETILLSCGCAVDFPEWQINLDTGVCKIYDYAGVLYLEFLDKETILEEDDE